MKNQTIIHKGHHVMVVPLKGTYTEGYVKSNINTPFEEVWEKIINLLEENGFSARMIDKSIGLIMNQAISFSGNVTFENKERKLVDPTAYIISERQINDPVNQEVKYNATAEWSLKIKQTAYQTTEIGINLHSIVIENFSPVLTGKSTGNFERKILDMIIMVLNTD